VIAVDAFDDATHVLAEHPVEWRPPSRDDVDLEASLPE
jgi:hypothetical protein